LYQVRGPWLALDCFERGIKGETLGDVAAEEGALVAVNVNEVEGVDDSMMAELGSIEELRAW
jgi:hypothetical protein